MDGTSIKHTRIVQPHVSESTRIGYPKVARIGIKGGKSNIGGKKGSIEDGRRWKTWGIKVIQGLSQQYVVDMVVRIIKDKMRGSIGQCIKSWLMERRLAGLDEKGIDLWKDGN